MKLIDKINVFDIIKNHLNTLVNYNTKKHGFSDYFTFLVIPTSISVAMYFLHAQLDADKINLIIVSLSIFIGLFFNVILLIFDIIHRENSPNLKREFLQQLLANISFSVLLALTTIVFAICSLVKIECVKTIAQIIVYFSLSLFIVTALMILKRLYNLFSNELDNNG